VLKLLLQGLCGLVIQRMSTATAICRATVGGIPPPHRRMRPRGGCRIPPSQTAWAVSRAGAGGLNPIFLQQIQCFYKAFLLLHVGDNQWLLMFPHPPAGRILHGSLDDVDIGPAGVSTMCRRITLRLGSCRPAEGVEIHQARETFDEVMKKRSRSRCVAMDH